MEAKAYLKYYIGCEMKNHLPSGYLKTIITTLKTMNVGQMAIPPKNFTHFLNQGNEIGRKSK